MGYGLAAEIATILTIILIVLMYRSVVTPGLTDADYAAFGQRVGAIVGVAGGTLYTFLFARLLMRALGARFVAHGATVAVTAIAFSIAGSTAGHHSIPATYLLASALKLAAGTLAGFLYSRSISLNRNVV